MFVTPSYNTNREELDTIAIAKDLNYHYWHIITLVITHSALILNTYET